MPAEIRLNTADSAAWSLLVLIRRGTPSMSVTYSARVPEGPGGRESGVMHTNKGPIPVLARRRRRRFQRRVTVGVFSQGGGGDKLSGPSAILLKEEHRRVVALRHAPTAAVRRARSARALGVALFPLARLAVYEEFFLAALKKDPQNGILPRG